jgi:hypothetical protein
VVDEVDIEVTVVDGCTIEVTVEVVFDTLHVPCIQE